MDEEEEEGEEEEEEEERGGGRGRGGRRLLPCSVILSSAKLPSIHIFKSLLNFVSFFPYLFPFLLIDFLPFFFFTSSLPLYFFSPFSTRSFFSIFFFYLLSIHSSPFHHHFSSSFPYLFSLVFHPLSFFLSTCAPPLPPLTAYLVLRLLLPIFISVERLFTHTTYHIFGTSIEFSLYIFFFQGRNKKENIRASQRWLKVGRGLRRKREFRLDLWK